MTYAIILAGGKGRRLWPVSRQNMPKQFVDFFGSGSTLLQQTYERMAKIIAKENIFVVTRSDFEEITRQQLPSLPHDNIVLETINRNTAPSTLLALRKISSRNFEQLADATQQQSVVIIPADQLILDEEKFKDAIERGASFVQTHECILTMGVTPSRPEPGYGYIQMGYGENDVHHIKSFSEKPDREFARMFIDSGEFLWNTGIYMSAIPYMKRQLQLLLNAADELDYSRLPNLSIDMAILEKMESKAVMHCTFGWADIGAWHGIYEALSNDETDNVLVNGNSRLLAEDSTHNVVALPNGKLAILSGLDGYIVAEKDDVLMICRKEDSSALVRKILSRIENEDSLQAYT